MISDRYFDLIFFGPMYVEPGLREFHDLFFFSIKSGNKVCVVDGTDLSEAKREIIREDYLACLESHGGVYFRRELVRQPTKTLRPITFGFPKEKATIQFPDKTKTFAMDSTAGGEADYEFSEENDYYQEYRNSYFGKTMRKGGWDCLRHYEIIFNRSIPFFHGIDEIPRNTMFNFPRELVKNGMKTLSSSGQVDVNAYRDIERQIFDYSMNHLTTEAIAKYVLEVALNS